MLYKVGKLNKIVSELLIKYKLYVYFGSKKCS